MCLYVHGHVGACVYRENWCVSMHVCVYVKEIIGGVNMQGGGHWCFSDISHCIQKSLLLCSNYCMKCVCC